MKYNHLFFITCFIISSTTSESFSFNVPESVLQPFEGCQPNRTYNESEIEDLTNMNQTFETNQDPNQIFNLQPILFQATFYGYNDLISKLLQAGANPNVRNTHNQTPLFIALCHKNTPVVNMLLSYGADVEDDHVNKAQEFNNDQEIITLFKKKLKSVTDPDIKSVTDQDKYKTLQKNLTACCTSVLKGCQPNRTYNKWEIEDLTNMYQTFKTKSVLRPFEGCEPNRTYNEWEIDNLINMNQTFKTNRDPSQIFNLQPILSLATFYGYNDLISKLLQAGANPNVRNTHNQTPLFIALCHKNTPVVNMLLSYGADVENDHVNQAQEFNHDQEIITLLKKNPKTAFKDIFEVKNSLLGHLLIYAWNMYAVKENSSFLQEVFKTERLRLQAEYLFKPEVFEELQKEFIPKAQALQHNLQS